LDLRDARPGRQSYSVDTTRTRLPAEVAVVSVEPAEVELALERLESRPLPVVVPVEGDPAPGSVVGTVQVIPPRLTVEGPESAIAGITSLPTTPVFIDGVAQSFQTTVEVVAVDPPLPAGRLRPGLGAGGDRSRTDTVPDADPGTPAEAVTIPPG
jgi:YbbR domain-containing protein